MRNITTIYLAVAVGAFLLLSSGCERAGGEYQGREYMPDMKHSIAYEANHQLYYENNTWGSLEEYKKMAEPRLPVEGTVAKEEQPYHFENTDAGRTLAELKITKNALPITTDAELEKAVSEGKFLYDIYCGVCHGKKGDGADGLWAGGDGPYPAKPADFTSDDLKKSTDGRYYHAIMYGKGTMQGHSDKLSYEERWKVIHYIRSMQVEPNEDGEQIYNMAVAYGGATNNETSPDTTIIDGPVIEDAHGGDNH